MNWGLFGLLGGRPDTLGGHLLSKCAPIRAGVEGLRCFLHGGDDPLRGFLLYLTAQALHGSVSSLELRSRGPGGAAVYSGASPPELNRAPALDCRAPDLLPRRKRRRRTAEAVKFRAAVCGSVRDPELFCSLPRTKRIPGQVQSAIPPSANRENSSSLQSRRRPPPPCTSLLHPFPRYLTWELFAIKIPPKQVIPHFRKQPFPHQGRRRKSEISVRPTHKSSTHVASEFGTFNNSK